jgi:uncharacterized phage protein (TIGR01671 family)
MREIIFKAKRTDNGEWVEGYYVKKEHVPFRGSCILANNTPESVRIGYTDVIHYMVDPETVCQYTGLTDKNGNKIFEGDIVKYIPSKTILQVLYINGAFAVTYIPNGYSPINWEIEYEGEDYDFAISNDYLTRLEVIGNIFDNPELLSQ